MTWAVLIMLLLLPTPTVSRDTLPPDGDLELRLFTSREEVELGLAFLVTIERRWMNDLIPEECRAEILAPLFARLIESERREKGGVTEEVLTFSCHAFSLDGIVIAAPSFTARPRSGGPARTVQGNRLAIAVKPLLDPADPGPAELPGRMLQEPASTATWPIGAAILAAFLVLLYPIVRRRSRQGKKERSSPPVPPFETAMQRLERLREALPATMDEMERFFVEASEMMREYLARRYSLPALERTTEELLVSPWGRSMMDSDHGRDLAEILRTCDAVKFGGPLPDEAGCTRLLDRASLFLRRTKPAEGTESK